MRAVAIIGGLAGLGAAAYFAFPQLVNASVPGVSGVLPSSSDPVSPDVQTSFFDLKVSVSDIAGYASAAGFVGDDLSVAVAVALAESGGHSGAYNPETAAGAPEGKGSVGLWQIYQFKHPEFSGWDLKDPQQNANAAFSVYRDAGYSFRPWSTYNSQAYQSYLTTAEGAVNT